MGDLPANGFTSDEIRRLRRVLRAIPDDAAADQAVEVFETYRAAGRIGKLFLSALKVGAVIAGGVIAWLQLRGHWWGKGS